jgi:Mg2+-importing ATPase
MAKTEKKLGLSSLEAARRLKQFGLNSVYRKQKLRPLVAFVKKFNSPLLLLLIAVSLVSLFVGQSTNAIILLLMVCVSVCLDFFNTYKSERAAEKLAAGVVTTATVYRDGKKQELPFSQIVPGDRLFLSAGDIVPADCQIMEAKDLFVNQSALTGESFPVEKEQVGARAISAEFSPQRPDLVFMGSSALTGYAEVEVVKTGRETEFGKIADRLAGAEPESDFEKMIKRFSMFITKVIFFLVIFVFFLNAYAGRDLFDSFLFAIAIAVGLTPELLPVIMTVSLSRGSMDMAKKDVIVKNLSSIQNFGSMNILCTDKTGTLTLDKIVLVKNVDCAGKDSEKVLLLAYLNSFYHSGVENPLDNAVKEYAKLDIKGYAKIDELPFDFTRKRESVVVSSPSGRLLISKGAPEEILKISRTYEQAGKPVELLEDTRKQISNIFNTMSQDGFRVLAIATKTVESKKAYANSDEEGMTFVGFAGFLDPPKESAKSAILELENLGIVIKILTGDNELLTQKICRDINLPVKGVIDGVEMDKLSDAELQKRVLSTTIFARITPEQKERIILNLKAAGQVVGYLGDGINDAPALKAAEVGISVNNAVDVAKETADIILLRKSLQVLKDGVMEGRRTFQNTMKYITMGLSSNFGNMFSMMAASALLPFLPMLPTQILLNNFFYDFSQLSLSSDDVDKEDIRKPSEWSMKFIKKYMLVFGPISSIFDFLTFGLLFWVYHLSASQFQTGWFIESFATQVFVIYVIRTRKIPFVQSWPSKLLLFNTIAMVVLAWATPYMPWGKFFQFSPLHPVILFSIMSLVFLYLVLVEAVKRKFYKGFFGSFTANRAKVI